MWWKKNRNQDSKPFVSAVIPAAGSSSRMGDGLNKLMMPLDGIPVLARTLLAFHQNPLVDEIIVVCREQDMMPYVKLSESFGIHKVSQVIRGGDSRTQSVKLGVEACAEQSQIVAIHDGARPLLQQDLLTRVITDAIEHGAAAPVVAMKDSIKKTHNGFIIEDVARDSIVAVQTPQVFHCADILRALKDAAFKGITPTDDCAAAERVGIEVFATAGSYTNLKITTQEDILIAQTLLQEIEA